MNKQEKSLEIESLKKKFLASSLAIVTDYTGLESNDMNLLRKKLRDKGADLKIIKNRLAKIAVQGTPLEFLADSFKGTTAVTLTSGDVAGVSKAITDFAKDKEQVKFKKASMDGKALAFKDLEALANLPSKEVLVTQLLGSMLAPARNWVSVLAQIPRQMVNVLAAVRDQKEKQG